MQMSGLIREQPASVAARQGPELNSGIYEQPSGSAGEQCWTEIFRLPGELRRGPGVLVVAVAERRDIDEVSRRGIPPDLGVDVHQIDPSQFAHCEPNNRASAGRHDRKVVSNTSLGIFGREPARVPISRKG